MKRFILLALLCIVLSLAAGAQAGPAARPASQGAARSVAARDGAALLRQQAFEIVWSTVKEKYFDPNFGGLDWDKVREQYAPRVAAVKNDGELYSLLQKMLGELGQSHFSIIPPEAVIEDDSIAPSTGGIGIDLQVIDGQAIITRVEPGSTAARAGLRPGFIVKQIDATAVEQVFQRFAKSKEPLALTRIRATRTLLALISGKPESAVSLVYLDERDRAHQATMARERLKGEMSQRFGNFPPQYTEFEAKRLAGGVGYIRFNIFVMSLLDKIRAAIRSMNDAPGVIIDLRGNPGGVGGMSSAIAGMLETNQASLGTMKMRAGHLNFAVFPQKGAYTGRVVVLIDGGSASTSEILAAGLQEMGRAVIVGERSAGAALPSIFQKLPTGALFQYAIADFKTPRGVLIEGRGVIPDVAVKLSRDSLLNGRDIQLEAAIEQIQKASARAGGK